MRGVPVLLVLSLLSAVFVVVSGSLEPDDAAAQSLESCETTDILCAELITGVNSNGLELGYCEGCSTPYGSLTDNTFEHNNKEYKLIQLTYYNYGTPTLYFAFEYADGTSGTPPFGDLQGLSLRISTHAHAFDDITARGGDTSTAGEWTDTPVRFTKDTKYIVRIPGSGTTPTPTTTTPTPGTTAPAPGTTPTPGATASARKVVTVTSGTLAGEYTVSWETLGGCDPGDGTSGSSGWVILTVVATDAPDGDPTPGELTGTAVEQGVVIHTRCTYEWTGSLTEATTGAPCSVGPSPFAPDADGALSITARADDCAMGGTITVNVTGPPDDADTPDKDESQPHRGAVLATVFTATATPVTDAPDGCSAVEAESEVDDMDTTGDGDDTVAVTLEVVDETADNKNCLYDVTLAVPPGFSVATNANVFENVDPGVKPGTEGVDVAADTQTVTVRVASRTIFLVQNVVGDAGGAYARYELVIPCGASYLPDFLEPRDIGGITPSDPAMFVELREGRYNVSAAVAPDPGAADAADGRPSAALNDEGEACEATATVSGLPGACIAEADSVTVDLSTSPDETILEMIIDCTPPAEEPAQDTTDTDPLDTGTDTIDTSTADMDTTDTNAGPLEDVATG